VLKNRFLRFSNPWQSYYPQNYNFENVPAVETQEVVQDSSKTTSRPPYQQQQPQQVFTYFFICQFFLGCCSSNPLAFGSYSVKNNNNHLAMVTAHYYNPD